MIRIFNADENKLIIDRETYANFRIWLDGQFKDAYNQSNTSIRNISQFYRKIFTRPSINVMARLFVLVSLTRFNNNYILL